MNTQNLSGSFQTLACLLAVAGASVLFSIPSEAKNCDNASKPSSSSKPVTEMRAESTTPAQPQTESMPAQPQTESMPADNQPSATTEASIVEIASKNGSFKTLTAALKAAGLVDTLAGKGPFTVFAPTDEAFAALPKETLEMLLMPENKDKLVKILTYHVVVGSVMSGDLVSGEVKTVEGSAFMVKLGDDKVMVNQAEVIEPDIEASNGVIHVIDKVIMPPQM